MMIISDTIENGEIENVHIAPIGDYKGSDNQGNPIDEHITQESLEQIAEKLNSGDDVLCDIDHQSCKPGVERDSKAAGWFYKFVVDPVKGLFANLKLTKKGKELLENREYRYTSPVFTLDENGNPNNIHSVALTNVPAFKGHISPILNSEPNTTNENKETIKMEITKEELVDIIKSTVTAMNSEPTSEVVSDTEVKEEVKEEISKDTDEVENSCVSETTDDEKQEEVEVKNEEVVSETTDNPETKEVEEVKEEIKDDETKEEVIKIESLNSAPVPSMNEEPNWKNLHGKAFFDWYSKHPNGI